MGKLFQDKKKSENQVAHDLSQFEAKAQVFCSILEQLRQGIRLVKTQNEFDKVVRQLITERQGAYRFLSEITNDANRAKVMVQVANDPKLKNLESLLKSLAKDLILSNEKLALSAEAMSFINGLKELKPVAEIMMNQAGEFAHRLSEANSLDVIEGIEAEILERNSVVEGALTRLIPYPEDESVADEILSFLQNNQELLDVLQSFALYEALEEDINNTKLNLQNSSSLT